MRLCSLRGALLSVLALSVFPVTDRLQVTVAAIQCPLGGGRDDGQPGP